MFRDELVSFLTEQYDAQIAEVECIEKSWMFVTQYLFHLESSLHKVIEHTGVVRIQFEMERRHQVDINGQTLSFEKHSHWIAVLCDGHLIERFRTDVTLRCCMSERHSCPLNVDAMDDILKKAFDNIVNHRSLPLTEV